MGLFGKKEEYVEPAPPPTQDKHGSLFSRRRSSPNSPNQHVNNHANHTTTNNNSSTGSKFGSILNRDKEDKSVTAARERVLRAEEAERQADRALMEARAEVREAKEHARRLEAEAADDLKRAQKKSDQSHDITKRANPLGKFGA